MQIWVVAEAFVEAFVEAFAEAFAEVAADITADIAGRTELDLNCGSGDP